MNNSDFSDPQSFEEFDNHKLITFNYDKKSGLCGYIAIHRLIGEYPSFGATRYWNYSSKKDALRDALRLSRAMSYKAALAGLPGGGAKAVIIDKNFSESKKNKIFCEYAKRVNYLSGKFVTGSDVGLTKVDVNKMRKLSPCFVGTKVDPVKYTALGIFHSIRISLENLFGNGDIQNRSFLIQGVGKVGAGLLELLYEQTHNIYVTDINDERLKFVKKHFPDVKVVNPETAHKKKVDIFSPCALSGCININNIHEFGCKIIHGGANNQLEDKSLGTLLHKMGILYAPDYVVNAGGLISVYDEFDNKRMSVRRINEKVFRISDTLGKIYERSRKENKSPSEVADIMAEKIFND